MAKGMPGCFQHANLMAAEAETVSFGNALVDAGYMVRFLFRPDDDASCLVLQGAVTCRMIAVMMGSENMGERPSLFVQGAADRVGIGCVDGCGHPELIIVDKHAEIVAAAEKLVNLQLRHRIFSSSR